MTDDPTGGRRWHWNEGNFGMLKIKEGALCCPLCGSEWTHIDDVYVAGRPREDGDIIPVHVGSTGHTRHGSEVDLPADVGRRHVFTLAGWCEGCGGHFGIEFKQHKGQTLISLLRKAWSPVSAS